MRECQRGRCPPQISHSRDQPGGPGPKKNPSAPVVRSLLSAELLSRALEGLSQPCRARLQPF
ncbi:MAG: hypothetical protein J7M32_10995 [Deltaproteobacteria bacterium]|nr:hypothetical protein [Deltaproteobacteria bacterium]